MLDFDSNRKQMDSILTMTLIAADGRWLHYNLRRSLGRNL